jgi:hypothetical protein
MVSFMRIHTIFFLWTLGLASSAAPLAPLTVTHTKVTQPVKKRKIIGTAWQQAIQNVYIPSSDAVTKPGNTVENQKDPAPQHTAKPAPQPISPPEQTSQKPSPEEMEMILAGLRHVFTSLDEEDDMDDAYLYYDDAQDDSNIPMNFSQFMHAINTVDNAYAHSAQQNAQAA